MTSIAKLKDRARKHEQKEDWQAAITAYRQVLETEQEADEFELELGLYNRIGDLHLRLGQTDDAVSYYEKAADLYAEAGFLNNAIALCNKALRHQSDRAEVYLKLSRLCAEQGFQTDARRWILQYAERQLKAGRVEDALTALEDFADLSDDPEIRQSLAQQLASHDRPREAIAQLRHAYRLHSDRGDGEAAAEVAESARSIDPSVDLESETPVAEPPHEQEAERGVEDEDEAGLELETYESATPEEAGAGAAGIEGLETRREEPGEVGAGEEPGSLSGLELSYSEQAPPASPDEVEADELGGLETFDAGTLEPADEEVDEGAGPGVEPLTDAGDEPEWAAEDPEEVEEELEPLPMLDTGFDEEADEEAEPLPLLDTGFDTVEEEADEGLEPMPSFDTADPSDEAMDLDFGSFDLGGGEPDQEPAAPADDVDFEAVLQRAREQVNRGLGDEALRELRLLSSSGADADIYRAALEVVNEIVRHDANDIAALQRRVEYATRTGDEGVVVDAYMDMADALARLGAETKAQAMYERVLDLDPDREAAREALGGVEDKESDTIDLDAVLREVEPEELAAGRGAGGGESDSSFSAMLSQFKAKVTDKVEPDEAGDHYDLGLAFKEMGLIDEAIAEFQTALTGGSEQLRVYEELGHCFMQKNQYTVALKVLNRALKVAHPDAQELLGVYYHLGQCHEELGQRAEARAAYGRVLALDETFADVPDRMARL